MNAPVSSSIVDLPWRRWLPWALLGIVLFIVLWLLKPVLAPFLIAAVLAYFGDPVADRLERLGLSRSISVTLVFLVVTFVAVLVAFLVVPVLLTQGEELIRRSPEWLARIQKSLGPWLETTLGIDPNSLNVDSVRGMVKENWGQAQGLLTQVVVSVGRSGGALLLSVVNLALVPVVTFYLLRDWDLMVAEIHRLVPRKAEPTVVRLAGQADEVLGAFLLGQFLVMISLGFVYSFGLWMIGLEFALLIGLLAGMVSFVPYLGSIVGAAAALAAMWFQTGDPVDLLWVVAVFGTGQALEGWVLTPWLVGDRIGLHPVAVIFAVMAGGQLFGFVGVMIGLPLAAVLMVLLNYARERWMLSEAYGPPADDPPIVGEAIAEKGIDFDSDHETDSRLEAELVDPEATDGVVRPEA